MCHHPQPSKKCPKITFGEQPRDHSLSLVPWGSRICSAVSAWPLIMFSLTAKGESWSDMPACRNEHERDRAARRGAEGEFQHLQYLHLSGFSKYEEPGRENYMYYQIQ